MKDEPIQGNAKLLRGRIQKLRKRRCRRDFFFTASDRASMGETAIAAGLAGLGGIASGLGSMAMDTAEEADLVEFELDGKAIRAWLWISVFREGDDVELVAEPEGDIWMGYGIRRISDRIVALHPHCSRGRYAHYKASFSWFVKIVGSLLIANFLLGAIVMYAKSLPLAEAIPFLLVSLAASVALALTYGVIAFRASMRFMGFVRLAEGIFRVFGWPDVQNIDLPAITRKSKKPGDPGALGILFFRY
ncbi:putative type VI secretion system effector [Trinickia sp. Y13]|uniref:putative type VI secretion system effector n=1 Tax=Trinickia sp. Y13 TaxID=2917807 RepID=UPI0024077603|nr:putative type VI secretion system effector [Trinickia sp. Y13]MDG0027132.1 hypothetical protein [Trinickia sp. Y13]